MPLFVSSKENRLLNELFLCVLDDIHTSQGSAIPKDASGAGTLALPPRPPPASRPFPAPRPRPVARGVARGRRRQTVAPRRRWCRTTRNGQTASRPPIRRRQTWSWRPLVAVERGCVGHTPSKTSRLQPAPLRLICQASLCKRVYSYRSLS
jgi:hypothetical protein